jgi:hypothetical protein
MLRNFRLSQTLFPCNCDLMSLADHPLLSRDHNRLVSNLSRMLREVSRQWEDHLEHWVRLGNLHATAV